MRSGTSTRNTDGLPGNGPDILRLVRRAAISGRGIGDAVRIGSVRGTVIGYNIARGGDFPGERFPLLIETELGSGKFALDEVTAA